MHCQYVCCTQHMLIKEITYGDGRAGTVSAKPIVLRAEYAYCPNLTIIDTPGFILKVNLTTLVRPPPLLLSLC